MTKTCIYHSWTWVCLVEQGWQTMFVDDGIATMYREEKRR